MKRSTLAAVGLVPAGVLVLGVTLDHAAASGGGVNDPGARVGGLSHARTTTPPRVFAVVASDGTKVRGKAVASTTRLSTGSYDVRFNRNITKCAWTGSVGVGSVPFGGSTGPVMIAVNGRAGTNNGLFVQTWNGSGAATDEPFSVVVICS
jgi:hypothetical protein